MYPGRYIGASGGGLIKEVGSRKSEVGSRKSEVGKLHPTRNLPSSPLLIFCQTPDQFLALSPDIRHQTSDAFSVHGATLNNINIPGTAITVHSR